MKRIIGQVISLGRIGLWFSLCLVLLYCVGCAGTKPQTAENQATPAKPAFDRSRLVRVRGFVKDDQGNPVTGVVGILFAIYEQDEGGATLWQEVQNVELDKEGHYIAVVGSTKDGGIPPELFAEEKTLWLGRQVMLNGEVEEPRMHLASTSSGLMLERVARSEIPIPEKVARALEEKSKAKPPLDPNQVRERRLARRGIHLHGANPDPVQQ